MGDLGKVGNLGGVGNFLPDLLLLGLEEDVSKGGSGVGKNFEGGGGASDALEIGGGAGAEADFGEEEVL